MCTQSRRHFLILTQVLCRLVSLYRLHNTLSLLLPPPLLWGERTMAENSQCTSLHNIMWSGNTGQTPISPPPIPWLHPSNSPSCLFQSLLHTDSTLSEKNKSRLKEKNYSVHDKYASSTKSTKNKTDLPPPLNPNLEERREKLWKRTAHKRRLSNSHRIETTGDRCLLPQLWGESAWLASSSHTCCESFSQNWPQAHSSLMPSPWP